MTTPSDWKEFRRKIRREFGTQFLTPENLIEYVKEVGRVLQALSDVYNSGKVDHPDWNMAWLKDSSRMSFKETFLKLYEKHRKVEQDIIYLQRIEGREK